MEGNVPSFIDVGKLLKKELLLIKIIIVIIQNFSIAVFTENDQMCFTIIHLKNYYKMI